MVKEASSNNNITVSIIIAVYNAEKNIGNCLASIAALQNNHVEIIIVDGRSVDNTIAIIKQFNTLNLRWVSEADNGIYDALNKGILLAKGKWLYFLGADDRLLPGFNEMLLHFKEDNVVYYGNSNVIIR